jgi:monofunctional biosynthetic peptidoglycan transglycosylase
MSCPTNDEPQPSSLVVVDFANVDEVASWRPIDDVVMGGSSASMLTSSGEGSAFFAGFISRENGGGFASARSPSVERELARCRGLRLRFRADGQTYRLRVRMDAAFDGIAYEIPFSGARGEWTVADLLFRDFVPVFRGSVVHDAEPLEPARILCFGIFIAREEPGTFRIELARLDAL